MSETKKERTLLDLWKALPLDIKRELVEITGFENREYIQKFIKKFPPESKEHKLVSFFMIHHFCASEEEQAMVFIEMNKFKLN